MRNLKLILLLCACVAVSQASAIVVPNALANVEGNGNNNIPFDDINPVRYQQVYAASQFGAGGLITQIAFRPDGLVGVPFSVTINNIQIDLSTTLAAPDALSLTYANNVGANDTVVFSGPLSISSADTGPAGGPKAFDILIPLMTPFNYNPGAGNLLLDVRNFSGLPSGAAGGFDSENLMGDSVSRDDGPIGTTATQTDTEGLVTQFTFAAATPEPGTLGLMGVGLVLVLVGASRRKRT